MFRPFTCLALACVLTIAVSAQAQDSKPTAAKPAAKPDIYDSKADVKALVEAACQKAKRDHSRVLVMLGGNWCGWCHKLHDLFKSDREIARVLLYEYQVVMADTAAKNAEELMKTWDVDTSKGVPYLVVLDEAGNVVTRQETGTLEEGDHHVPSKVKAFLDAHTAKPPTSQATLDAALARAASEDKRVFLHFGAPWCGWCHKLEDFLAIPAIAEILGQDFIDVKIDTDRMAGGEEMLAKYCKKQGGIPWFVVLDSSGKPLATSDSAKGNVGYPVEPHEIEHFMSMLKQTVRRTTPEQLDKVHDSLTQRAAEIKGARSAARNP